MKKIFYILLLFTSSQLIGQSKAVIEFYPLSPIDTISSLENVEKLKRIDHLKNDNYFFAVGYRNKDGLFFLKKNRNKWIVFDFEFNLIFGSNNSISKIQKESENFISIQIYRAPSGSCSNIYGFLSLLDIENCKIVNFSNYNSTECYDTNGKVSSKGECKADLEVKNDIIKINSTKKHDDGLYCAESAEYRIENNTLIKTKYYSEATKTFFPIRCFENICTGRNFNDFKKEFPKATFKEIPLFAYGYDSDKLGYEMSINGKVQIFLAVSEEKIAGISFVSPVYEFNGINTTTTILEVFEKYPKIKIHIDLISGWEYVYLKKERIKLNFKTDTSTSIGIYGDDPEDGTTSIKRKNAKIDFIQLF